VRLLVTLAAVLAFTGCGSRDHASRIFTATGQVADSPGGARAGGPASLRIANGHVTAKALLVVRVRGRTIVVRNPRGGTLSVTHRQQAGTRANAVPGDHVSFTGTIDRAHVSAATVVVIG
jgi:hypothetical protein